MAEKKKFNILEIYRKHPIIWNIVLILLSGVVIVWAALFFLDVWTHHGETTTVPEIRDLSYEEARKKLSDADLMIEISDSIYDRDARPGIILESFPKAGAVVKPGRQVFVTITSFTPKQVTVSTPLINSVSERQAKSYLYALGIKDITTVYVPGQFADLVIDARYDGGTIGVGTRLPVTAHVTLEISTLPQAVEESTDTITDIDVEMPDGAVINQIEDIENGGFFD